MACDHAPINREQAPGDSVIMCSCRSCGHRWRECAPDLFAPDRIAGTSALALLTPRAERTLPQQRLLGFT